MKFQNSSKTLQLVYLPSETSGFWPTEPKRSVGPGQTIEVTDPRDIAALRRLSKYFVEMEGK